MNALGRLDRAMPMAAAALLAACTSQPPAPPTSPSDAVPSRVEGLAPSAGILAFQRRQSDLATAAESQGHWAAAVLAWEVLTLLKPEDPQVRQRWAEARRRAETLATERRAVAEAAQRRGDLDAASLSWLEVLALDPTQRAAADALRQVERERYRRSLQGRFSRQIGARRPGTEVDMNGVDTGEQGRSVNSVREHATLLSRQGDLDGAIQLLKDTPQTRNETGLRALLVDLHVQKAESLKQRQPEAARAAVEAALAIDRRHAGALALQQQLSLPPRPRPLSGAGAASAPTR